MSLENAEEMHVAPVAEEPLASSMVEVQPGEYEVSNKEFGLFLLSLIGSPAAGSAVSIAGLEVVKKLLNLPPGTDANQIMQLALVQSVGMGVGTWVGVSKWLKRQDRLEAKHNADLAQRRTPPTQ